MRLCRAVMSVYAPQARVRYAKYNTSETNIPTRSVLACQRASHPIQKQTAKQTTNQAQKRSQMDRCYCLCRQHISKDRYQILLEAAAGVRWERLQKSYLCLMCIVFRCVMEMPHVFFVDFQFLSKIIVELYITRWFLVV